MTTLRHVLPSEWALIVVTLVKDDADQLAFFRCPLDSVVGRSCFQLLRALQLVEALRTESDDFATMRRAAVHTMIVWYFG